MAIIKTATISECGLYRYSLTRIWNRHQPVLTFVMLNPSTADASNDDPTIRRCVGFATREDCGGIRVVNAYAYRATNPSDLDKIDDPIGPENDFWLRNAARDAWGNFRPIVCAWGARIDPIRAAAVLRIFHDARANTVCLGKTKHGCPKHPLYVRAAQPFLPFGEEVHA